MRRLLPLIAVLSLDFAPAPPPKTPKPAPAQAHLRAMQGRWDRTSGSYGRFEMTGRDANIRIVEDKVSFFLGDRLRDEWTISLKPEKDAKRFEAKIISGDHKGCTVSGTYHLQGDVLVLTYLATIPQGLVAVSEQALVVLTYSRKKP